MVEVDVKDRTIHEESTQETGTNDEPNSVLNRIRINSNIKDLDKSWIQKEIIELVKKYESILTDSIIEVFIRLQNLGIPNQKIIYTRILIITSKERFDVTAEHHNIKLSFYKALFRLENQFSNKEFTVEFSQKKFPYNLCENSSYKGVSHKIIKRKIHNNGVIIGT